MRDRSEDVLLRRLASLTPILPDPLYTSNVRALCHAALERERRRRAARMKLFAGRHSHIDGVVVAGFALVYVSAVVFQALASFGVR
jgi:hypothetical protein